MMSDIYRRASYVYVWLGKSDDYIELAMKTIKADFRQYYDADHPTKRSGKRRKLSRDKEADLPCNASSRILTGFDSDRPRDYAGPLHSRYMR
jgi:hypothetical protein